MAKTNYWLTDGYGSKALVEGADQRDRWVPLGWSEADAPAGGDRVWMQHTEHGGHAQFPAGVVDTWQALGWKPAPPPEPVDVLHDAQLVDVQTPVAEPAPANTDSSTSTRTADSGAKQK
ncbi:hypothetical protein [Micromonospora sp. DPT]|uniref:hypothetical protein n=1 Tax=Micromonospora sp. DPT TaxID=3142975 RepID=UPI0032096009